MRLRLAAIWTCSFASTAGLCLLNLASPPVLADSPSIRLAADPAVSPDGAFIAFGYQGDVWIVPSDGGQARRLTNHPASDSNPQFSPDGKQIAFVSDREAHNQVYVMPVDGGVPQRLTHHTEGYRIEGWYPNGESLLVSSSRDHHWRSAQRFYRLPVDGESTETLLFDAYGNDASVAPDGKRILFVREGERWWRKGYTGSRSAQVWLYDADSEEFTQLLNREGDCRWPIWEASGEGFYYTNGDIHGFDLWRYRLERQSEEGYVGERVVNFEEDSVTHPAISRDGSTIVFRRLFDLFRYRPLLDAAPAKLAVFATGEAIPPDADRRSLDRADSAAFSRDGLEIAFIAGGDAFVMDTELREPVNLGASGAGRIQHHLFARRRVHSADQRARRRVRYLSRPPRK